MGWVEALIPHAAPFLLVAFRLLGLFAFTPLLSSGSVTRQVKVMVSVSFAAAVYPSLAPSLAGMPEPDLFTLAGLMFTEVMIGVAIGMIASLPLVFLQMSGYLMGYQMGLALAQAYNPELDSEAGVLGEALYFLGMGAFVTMGGLEAVFVSLLGTFQTVPPGSFEAGVMPLDVFVGVLHSGFAFALSVCAPVLAVVLMILVAIGFIMKTMPQINVMSVGFAMKIVAGVGAVVASLFVINGAAGDEITRVLVLVAEWAHAPGGR